MSAEEKLERSKMLVLADPKNAFYAAFMCSLTFRLSEDGTKGTAYTNGKEVVISPSFLLTLSREVITFVIMHELMHVVLQHITRRGDRDPKRWNDANDYWINSFLKSMGYTIWDHALLDDKNYPHTLSSDEIYAKLPDEPNRPNPMGGDIVEPGEGEDPLELEAEIQGALIQAVTQARILKAAGNIPQNVLIAVEEYLNPVLPWYTILQKYMNDQAKDDYSWKRRNRRFRDIYLPSLYSEKMGELDVYIDLSISVSDAMVAMQIGQIKWIKNNLMPTKINIIPFNTRIIDVFTFHEEQPIDVQFTGRGGTDIREIVERMSKNTAQVSIVLTDGYFSMHDLSDIRHDILWCIYDNTDFPVDKGKVIYVLEEAIH